MSRNHQVNPALLAQRPVSGENSHEMAPPENTNLKDIRIYYENLLRAANSEYHRVLQDREALEKVLLDKQKSYQTLAVQYEESKKDSADIKNEHDRQQSFWENCLNEIKDKARSVQSKNHQLALRLGESDQRVEYLSRHLEEKEKHLVSLRHQLQKSREEIEKIRQENQEFRTKIAISEAVKWELRSNTSDAIAIAVPPPPPLKMP